MGIKVEEARVLLALTAGLLVLAFLQVAVAGAASGSAKASAAFCSAPTLRNYEAAFEALPPVQALPSSGRTSFSPAGVRINDLRFPGQRVVPVGGTLAGYQIENRSLSSAASVDWEVTSRLERFAADGQLQLVSEEPVAVASLAPRESVHVGGGAIKMPGVVRQSLEFKSSSTGQLLGAYAEYVRAARSKDGTRLEVSKAVLRAGGAVISRVENYGPAPMGYGRSVRLERLTKKGWRALPGGDVGFSSMSTVPPGTAGRCLQTRIPRSATAGRYRLTQTVVRIGAPVAKRQALRASFVVTAGEPR